MSYNDTYPKSPARHPNPYPRCAACGFTVVQINGEISNHHPTCSWRMLQEQGLPKPVLRGPWFVDKWGDGKLAIQSEDFVYDAALLLSGDFESQDQKFAYALKVSDTLNLMNAITTTGKENLQKILDILASNGDRSLVILIKSLMEGYTDEDKE